MVHVLAPAGQSRPVVWFGLAPHIMREERGVTVKAGYRLIIVDQAGVLVSEFQLTENALAQPEAFVAAIKQVIEDVEESET
ncbi:MAG TPA: hypothetical protein VKP13_04390 [Nitrospira sp.]|nr:hypothetical protein [Nitrospira sp.]